MPRVSAARAAAEAGAVGAAVAGFAIVAHQGMPWAAAGFVSLLTAAVLIGRSVRASANPRALLGLENSLRGLWPALAAGAVLGVGGGLLYRADQAAAAGLATGIRPFVVVACLIGVTEELVYRGWMMSRTAALGWPGSVLVAALAHTGYKVGLFVWLPDHVAVSVNLPAIAIWTMAGGLLLGLLRAWSSSVLPAVLAHAAFDAVVYASRAQPPWWVWS